MPHLDASALARDPDGLATLAGVLRPFSPPMRVVRSGAEAGHPGRAAPRTVEGPRAGPTARALMAARALRTGAAGARSGLPLH
jgi:hypothetical protein